MAFYRRGGMPAICMYLQGNLLTDSDIVEVEVRIRWVSGRLEAPL